MYNAVVHYYGVDANARLILIFFLITDLMIQSGTYISIAISNSKLKQYSVTNGALCSMYVKFPLRVLKFVLMGCFMIQ